VSQSDFVTRGQALVSSGQFQEAVKVCRLGLLGRPTTVEGRVVLGQALLALKRYDEVLAEMRVALELDHGSNPALVLKGEALLRKGDGHGAWEALGPLRDRGVADARVASLLAEAERLVARLPPGKTGHAAVGRVAPDPDAFAAEPGTRNYPAQAPEPMASRDRGEAGGEYTRPTSIAAPKQRSSPNALAGVSPQVMAASLAVTPARDDATPSPAMLAVGDRSGTVEVDPEVDDVVIRPGDDDLGEVVGPPVARDRGDLGHGMRDVGVSSSRPSKLAAVAAAIAAKKPRRAAMFKEEASTVELDDEEVIEVAETLSPESPAGAWARKLPGPGTAVRNAVRMPSGPLDQPVAAALRPPPAQPAPSHLAQLIASQPHVMNVVPAPQPSSRSAIAAALPTAAALPMHPMQTPHMQGAPVGGQGPPHMQAMPVHGPSHQLPPQPFPPPQYAPPQYAPPQYAPPQFAPPQYAPPQFAPPRGPQFPPVPPAQGYPPGSPGYPPMQPIAHHQHAPAAGDAAFGGHPEQGPAWARATVMAHGPGYPAGRAAADEPTRQPQQLDPRLAAILGEPSVDQVQLPGQTAEASASKARPGARKVRSRLRLVVWVLIGGAVIGGGVFAGFQIRTLRLHKQIAVARVHAVDLARADTWQGWVGARASLAGIAEASPTIDNRAAVARARALLAFEFGDGTIDAAAALDGLAGQGGLDAAVAAAYVGLARSDVQAARDAGDRAKQVAPTDAAALYVAGRAALLAGDVRAAIDDLRSAFEREPRQLYAVGLARAHGASSAWDDALTTVARAGDNPAALIAKATLLAGAGRLSAAPAGEIRAQLQKVIAEGQKPPGDQVRGVSPAQVAFAMLALTQVDFARGDRAAVLDDYRAVVAQSRDQGVEDQRFAEELTSTLYSIGELASVVEPARAALRRWPASREARVTLAQALLGLDNPTAAAEQFPKAFEVAGWPRGQTVRGQVRQANGDLDGARADLDSVLKSYPAYEPALAARSWLDAADGKLAAAKQRIEARFNPKAATPALVIAYAAILRMSGESAKAKPLLERVVSAGATLELARAQLELGRTHRDLGDGRAAREAYAAASLSSFEARIESGVLMIEDGNLAGGRATLERLLVDAGDHPSAALLLEAARARALLGDHVGAAALHGAAEKAAGVVRWQLERERGRLALRKGDHVAAALALGRALGDCGNDIDTFILAADTVAADPKQTALASKLRSLAPERLKGMPELDILAGKAHLAAMVAAGRGDEAAKAFAAAEKAYTAANAAFSKGNMSARRRAQANFGLGALIYESRDDPNAIPQLELASNRDPSLFAVYLYLAEIARAKASTAGPQAALELALRATSYNPDSLDAWLLAGELAAAQNPKNRRVLNDAITRVGYMAPGTDQLRKLQALR
jgi:hypothetical protein